MNSKRALVLAFDEKFAVGAETLLFSVLRHNAWFDARVIVIADDLGTEARVSLSRLYPVEFVAIDLALKSIVRRVARSGAISSAGARLSSLQLFDLPELERAVFLDVDTICLGDVRALFDETSDFAAAPDALELEQACRRGPTSASHAEPEPALLPYGKPLDFSFNSGVMTVSRRWLTGPTYHELLALPGLERFTGGVPALADQYVLNRYFEGKVSPLDPRYNFVVSTEALLRAVHGLTLADARVLHFAGFLKPWTLSWTEARRRVPPRFLRYYDAWYEHREALLHELDSARALEQYTSGLEELSLASRAIRQSDR